MIPAGIFVPTGAALVYDGLRRTFKEESIAEQKIVGVAEAAAGGLLALSGVALTLALNEGNRKSAMSAMSVMSAMINPKNFA